MSLRCIMMIQSVVTNLGIPGDTCLEMSWRGLWELTGSWLEHSKEIHTLVFKTVRDWMMPKIRMILKMVFPLENLEGKGVFQHCGFVLQYADKRVSYVMPHSDLQKCQLTNMYCFVLLFLCLLPSNRNSSTSPSYYKICKLIFMEITKNILFWTLIFFFLLSAHWEAHFA